MELRVHLFNITSHLPELSDKLVVPGDLVSDVQCIVKDDQVSASFPLGTLS